MTGEKMNVKTFFKNLFMGAAEKIGIYLSQFLQKIKTQFKKIKKAVVLFAAAFILGCLCSGFAAYRYNKSVMRQDRAELQQYRAESEKLNSTIAGLQKSLAQQQSDYNRLENNNSEAIAGLAGCTKSITATGSGIDEIRSAVRAIRKACKVLEDDGNCGSSGNSRINNSGDFINKKVK
jgi:septal ring factor EnvC (AmiA/AmiB activator)